MLGVGVIKNNAQLGEAATSRNRYNATLKTDERGLILGKRGSHALVNPLSLTQHTPYNNPYVKPTIQPQVHGQPATQMTTIEKRKKRRKSKSKKQRNK